MLLPPAPATLLDQQISQLRESPSPQGHRRLLLPGAVPGRPRNPGGLADQMRTAMPEAMAVASGQERPDAGQGGSIPPCRTLASPYSHAENLLIGASDPQARIHAVD